MAKRKNIKKDVFQEVSKLQEELMGMYKDRELKGYKSIYKLNDIKSLEVRVNSLNDELLADEYNLKEFTELRDSQVKLLNLNIAKEAEILKDLDVCRRSIRLATLRKNSLGRIINENEGEGYITDIDTKNILDEMDITDFDKGLFCREFQIDVPDLNSDDFVLKMFSFFRENEAYKHYSNGDLAVLFRRNFVVDGKRLSFVKIKELYYADEKTSDTYSKIYKIIRDKFRKHIKFHPEELVF